MSRILWSRGGVAAGDPTQNRPKIAGSYTGFVGVLVGAGILILLVIISTALLRYRTLRRKERLQRLEVHTVDSWVNDDAFEMPRTGARGLLGPAASQGWAASSTKHTFNGSEISVTEPSRPDAPHDFYGVPTDSEVFLDERGRHALEHFTLRDRL
ncbi:BQ2448_5747 [Microbotryum intermedium]|uniref:BQ2448_5747 protein n=1 Tax=Microbotryum intermedium TaxID=269621 RepID=A0A238F554_9BASI|nr:BQ2448_5747 [Microbotryum intermedium]